MRTLIGIHPANAAGRTADDRSHPTPTVWFDSWPQLAGLLSDQNHAVRPEALATAFLVVLDSPVEDDA